MAAQISGVDTNEPITRPNAIAVTVSNMRIPSGTRNMILEKVKSRESCHIAELTISEAHQQSI
jgi:hypothetical protein